MGLNGEDYVDEEMKGFKAVEGSVMKRRFLKYNEDGHPVYDYDFDSVEEKVSSTSDNMSKEDEMKYIQGMKNPVDMATIGAVIQQLHIRNSISRHLLETPAPNVPDAEAMYSEINEKIKTLLNIK